MNYKYFFETIERGAEVLPIDLRTEEKNIQAINKNNIDSIKELINHYILNGLTNNELKNNIISDVVNIIKAVIKNEGSNTLELINISRFSMVYKLSTKVIKIGFPKITYIYPKSKFILDSIIRKNYYDENNNIVMFIEVQDYKDNNVYEKFKKEELEEIIYQIWKYYRKKDIIWFDPKDKNVVLSDKTKTFWNNNIYNRTSDEEKGIYLFDDYDYTDYGVLIVDNDLFLSLSTYNELLQLEKEKPKLPGFSNWKHIKVREFEKRYEEEKNNGKI